MFKEVKAEYNNAMSKFIKKKLYLNTHMNITDNSFIEIENIKRIIEYNDICIELETSTLRLRIWGKNLLVCDYNTDGIVIKGEFSSIEFIN